MAIRVKSKWNSDRHEHTVEEIASVVAFTIWRLSGQGVLNLENEGFQTDTYGQRLLVIREFSAFLLHIADRLSHEKNNDGDRQQLVVQIALKMADYYQDNRADVEGSGQYRQEFIDLLNERMNDYAEFGFDDGEPGYAMKRYFGECVTEVMGPKDRKWVSDQVMDIEVPQALKSLKKALKDQVAPSAPEEEIPDFLREKMPDDI